VDTARYEALLVALLVFFLTLPVLSRLCAADLFSPYTDFRPHYGLTERLAEFGEVPPHPLFHLCLLALALGHNPLVYPGVTAALLALALAGRAYLSALLFSAHGLTSFARLAGLCLALVLVMPAPNWWRFPGVYVGMVSPNVWHNPTGVFAMPFALLLFLLGVRALDAPGFRAAAAVGGAMVLSLLAKPNYVLAFAPCFAVALLVAAGRAVRERRLTAAAALGQAGVIFVPALAVLGYQFGKAFGQGSPGEGRVSFDPLAAWSLVTPNVTYVPASILLGIAFPLAVTALYGRQALRDRPVVLAWAVLAVAVAQYTVLFEAGGRAQHGNFAWGMVLAAHVLFVACCDLLIRQPPGVARRIAFGVLGVHVFSGFLYLSHSLADPARASLY
jgi:hypothetical protein